MEPSIIEFTEKHELSYKTVLRELDCYLSSDEIEEFIKDFKRSYDINDCEEEEDYE